MNRSQIEPKNRAVRAAVIAWVALSLTWTAACAQDASGPTQPASGSVDSASRRAAEGEAVDPAKIDQLIAQLGANEFAVREAATKALIKIGDEALEALKKAVESDDAEVAFRARQRSTPRPAHPARLPSSIFRSETPLRPRPPT
jgi:HEAT repeat protein